MMQLVSFWDEGTLAAECGTRILRVIHGRDARATNLLVRLVVKRREFSHFKAPCT